MVYGFHGHAHGARHLEGGNRESRKVGRNRDGNRSRVGRFGLEDVTGPVPREFQAESEYVVEEVRPASPSSSTSGSEPVSSSSARPEMASAASPMAGIGSGLVASLVLLSWKVTGPAPLRWGRAV